MKTKGFYLLLAKRFTSNDIKLTGQTSKKTWESVIGLEIHAQIACETKLFARSGCQFGARVNNQVTFTDAALPGTLPVINKKCVEAGVTTALALNCNINYVSKFDRKHYFYADLPAGYQVTQQRQPIATNGLVEYLVENTDKGVKFQKQSARITQLQLEQDSGKSLHDGENASSLIDLNRAGVALMEIVTEPDFRTGEEAAAFVKELQSILQTIGTCDGKMEEGSMRVDASISIRKPGDQLGVRTEVKNINSRRYVSKAIQYEIKRQIKVLESGHKVTNETRSFDYETGKTLPMRDKEKLHDYRFLPEPNLPPLRIYSNKTLPKDIIKNQVVNVDLLRDLLPELPQQQRDRLVCDYQISTEQAIRIVNEPGMLTYFEAVMNNPGRNVKRVVNILMNNFLEVLNENNTKCWESLISPVQVGEVTDLVDKNIISLTSATKILKLLYNQPQSDVENLIETNNLRQISDADVIEKLCQTVILDNPKALKNYQKGKKKAFQFLVNQALKKSEERADPKIIVEKLQKLLQS